MKNQTDHALLEHLYDFRHVCQALLTQKEQEACGLFLSRSEILKRLPRRERPVLRRTMLVSLNRGIYNYVLLTCGCSLARCCHCNMNCSQRCRSHDEFCRAACEIIENYAEALKEEHPGDRREFLSVCHYIRSHLSEPLTLESVAGGLYMSRSHLCRLFRTWSKMSFSEYLCRERIERARELLSSGGLSVTAVAQQCGFSSSAYFSTCFKKLTGCTPREYCR